MNSVGGSRGCPVGIFSLIILLYSEFAAFSVTTHYVDANGLSPHSPYTSWAAAATNIQDAINIAAIGDHILVTNGVYQYGGVYDGVSNRVYVYSGRPVIIESVNGPAFTTILGITGTNSNPFAWVRCIRLIDGSVLSGFTVTNGGAYGASGGGVYCEGVYSVVSNCIIVGNSSGRGGGMYSGTAVNCVLSNNLAFGGPGGGGEGGGFFNTIASNCLISSNVASNFGGGGGAFQGALSNCRLISNAATSGGGGTDQASLTNCIVVSNTCGYSGGGAFRGTLFNCLVAGNTAGNYGGGAASAKLINCTVANNSASISAGGVYAANIYGAGAAVLLNSIIYFNNAASDLNYGGSQFTQFTNCCTFPLPASGEENFTNSPSFVDPAAADFHLRPDSPCINAGKNFFLHTAIGSTVFAITNDLDGHPRFKGYTVDLGPYEFPSPTSLLPPLWAEKYGLPTDGSADFIDSDGDGMNNWQEFIADTNPTDPGSVLRMFTSNSASGMIVGWQSSSARNYFLQGATPLVSSNYFLPYGYFPGQPGATTYTNKLFTILPFLIFRVRAEQ